MSNGVVYQAKSNVAWDHIRDEVAMLDTAGGLYYGLNVTGAVVWQALQQPNTLDAIVAAVGEQFALPSVAEGRRDVLALLNQLVSADLVTAQAADGA